MLLLLLGTFLTALALALAYRRLPRRTNYAGESIPASAGLLFIPIILTTGVIGAAGGVRMEREGGAYLCFLLLSAVVGWLDDVWSGAGARGFRGHLGALFAGKVTTGMVKVLALGGGALALGALLFGPGVRALVAAFLVAGCTNLGNLFDVRPGRALKFVGVPICALLLVAPREAVVPVIGVVGGAIILFYFDLKGRIMLGDAGAAVWGAVLGLLVVAIGPGVVWWVAGGAILFLTAVAEVSSISRFIEEVRVLRWFDFWGRG